MALPRVLGKGSSDPLPTLRINDLNLSCLLWLTVFLILPHPFQGWEIIIAQTDYCICVIMLLCYDYLFLYMYLLFVVYSFSIL